MNKYSDPFQDEHGMEYNEEDSRKSEDRAGDFEVETKEKAVEDSTKVEEAGVTLGEELKKPKHDVLDMDEIERIRNNPINRLFTATM